MRQPAQAIIEGVTKSVGDAELWSGPTNQPVEPPSSTPEATTPEPGGSTVTRTIDDDLTIEDGSPLVTDGPDTEQIEVGAMYTWEPVSGGSASVVVVDVTHEHGLADVYDAGDDERDSLRSQHR